jgi:hypothetical protein
MAKKQLLTLAISELQRVNDNLNHNYDQARVKVLTFLGAGLATLTYLYGSGDLFIPKEQYGIIFYCSGLGLTIAGLIVLFIALLPVTWYYATETSTLRKLKFSNEEDMLEYVKEEYIITIEANSKSYEKKQKMLTVGSYMLIIGAIILVILSKFGG